MRIPSSILVHALLAIEIQMFLKLAIVTIVQNLNLGPVYMRKNTSLARPGAER